MRSFKTASSVLADSACRYDALFRQAATRHPDRPAMIYRDRILTYRDALSTVDRLTYGLHALGLRRGDCLGLHMSNRPEFSLTFLAAASLGLVVTPMSASCKDHELHYQLANAEVQGIVLEPAMLPALQRVLTHHPLPLLHHIVVLNGEEAGHVSPNITPFSALLAHPSPQQLPVVQVQPDDLLALPYSSGTTGLPKGVMLTHHNLAVNHLQFIQSLGLSHSDVALLFLPFSHIYGFMLTGSFLGCGGTQVIMEQFDLLRALTLCKQHHVTHLFAIPSIVQMLAQVNKDLLTQLDSVRCIFCGAAPLPLQPALQLQQKVKATVVQAYGLTEAAPLTHAQPRLPHAQRLASIGKPVEQTEQKIVDVETGTKEVPVGTTGEMLIRGPQIMQGYWNAPEETALVLRQGWLHTGDIGYLDEEGYAYIVDRKKDMIKHKGFSIAPAELEAMLLQHPSVHEAAVIGLEDETVGEQIKGFVVLRQGEHVEVEALLEFANSKLAHHKQLHSLAIVAQLPHTSSGKISRRLLKERERTRQAAIAATLPY